VSALPVWSDPDDDDHIHLWMRDNETAGWICATCGQISLFVPSPSG
jgi:hypothetical protein